MRHAIIGLLLSLAVVGCNGSNSQLSITSDNGSASINQNDRKVLNGVAVSRSESPQFVQIEIPTAGGSQLCSGMAIGKDAVLTAAHCFLDMNALPIVNLETKELEASSVSIHPGFTPREDLNAYFFDVAVLAVPGLDLPSLPLAALQPVAPGDTGTVYGFGINDDKRSGDLTAGDVTLSTVTENHLVTEFDGSGANPCFGDSGAPLIKFFEGASGERIAAAIGITSSGSLQSCGKGDTTLYTAINNPVVVEFIASLVPDLAVF